MNQLQLFDFEGNQIRTLTTDKGETWWVLSDVCKALRLSNPSVVASRIDPDSRSKSDLGRQGEAVIVNESGLYEVILRSDKPEAKQFRKWVTHEVLPSIRKHGGYLAGQETMTPEEMVLASVNYLKSKIAEQRQQLENQAPKVLFADSVETSRNSILIGQFATDMRQNGVDIGQNRMFKWMRDHGYLCARKGEDWNQPTQRSLDMGLFEVKTRTFNNPDGSVRTTRTTKLTGKGRIYFTNKFLGKDNA